MSEVTVRDLDELTEQLAKKEKLKAELAALVTQVNKEIMILEQKCTLHLKELERTEYSSPYGKVTIKEMWSVNLPDTPTAKKLFFDWLRSREIFDKYATVNSRSLQSLFKVEWEEAKKTGNMNFSLPGIEAPKLFEKTDFKPNKEVKTNEPSTNEPNDNKTSARGIDPDEPIPY